MTTDAQQQSDPVRVRYAIFALSCVLAAAVVAVLSIGQSDSAPAAPSLLARANVVFNAGSLICLGGGWYQIRRGRREAHRRFMLGAVAFSTAFLVSYLAHHASVGSVPFHGTGALRIVYLAILIPHILLAALMVPLVLFTLYRAGTQRFQSHRRIARITLPIWAYVCASGIAVYVLLYHVG